jgi:hypothetical protein
MAKKKYNPNKNLQRLDPDKVVANTAIFQLPEQKNQFFHVPTGKILSGKYVNLKALARVYTNVKFNWVVALVVFKVDSKGDKAMDVHHVAPPMACKADWIEDSVHDIHHEMINKIDDREYLCAGYVAVPREEYLSSADLFKMFDRFGIWEQYITNKGYVLNEHTS